MPRRMEYVDSWLFNRGQEITLSRGTKYWHASVQLFNRYPEFPYVYLKGKDKEQVLLKALKLIREDAAKDNQEVLYLDEAFNHGVNVTPFPLEVRGESQEMEELKQSPEFRELVDKMVSNVHVHELEKQWREGG